MKREKLTVEKRKITGKKVKNLRREGILPANIYGKDFKSVSVQVPLKDFEKVFGQAGETGVIDIALSSQTIPVLIHNIHQDYLGNFLHADFYKVNLSEKVKTMVPIEIAGEPKAVTDKIGLLMQILNEVEVEALPTELPEKIEVNVENLANIDDQITVGDLKVSGGVTLLSDPNQVIVKIDELVSKEAEELAAEEAAAAEEAKAEAAAEAGEVQVEGEEKPVEGEEVKEQLQGEKKEEPQKEEQKTEG